MNSNEWGRLAAALNAMYRKQVFDCQEQIGFWFEMLKDLEYTDLSQVVKQWAMSQKFPPTIADLREGVNRLRFGDKLGEMEAWNLVMKAIRNSAYNAGKEYAALPEAVQKAVGGPETLKEWAMSEDFNEDVAMSHFLRAYKVSAERESRDRLSAPALIDQIKARRLELEMR